MKILKLLCVGFSLVIVSSAPGQQPAPMATEPVHVEDFLDDQDRQDFEQLNQLLNRDYLDENIDTSRAQSLSKEDLLQEIVSNLKYIQEKEEKIRTNQALIEGMDSALTAAPPVDDNEEIEALNRKYNFNDEVKAESESWKNLRAALTAAKKKGAKPSSSAGPQGSDVGGEE